MQFFWLKPSTLRGMDAVDRRRPLPPRIMSRLNHHLRAFLIRWRSDFRSFFQRCMSYFGADVKFLEQPSVSLQEGVMMAGGVSGWQASDQLCLLGRQRPRSGRVRATAAGRQSENHSGQDGECESPPHPPEVDGAVTHRTEKVVLGSVWMANKPPCGKSSLWMKLSASPPSLPSQKSSVQ